MSVGGLTDGIFKRIVNYIIMTETKIKTNNESWTVGNRTVKIYRKLNRRGFC